MNHPTLVGGVGMQGTMLDRTFPSVEPGTESGPAPLLKVLVVRMSSFGDIVHTLPALAVIRDHWPGAVVDWLVQAGYDRLVARVRGVRRIWTLRGWVGSPQGPTRRALRAERYTWAVDFQGLLKSALWTWRSRAAFRLGFHTSDLWEPIGGVFYNRRSAVRSLERARLHVVEKNALLLTGMGLDAESVRDTLRRLSDPARRLDLLAVPPEADERVRSWLAAQGLRPGDFWVFQGGASRPAKRWPLEACRQVLRDVYEATRRPVVVLGGVPDAERVQALAEAARPADVRRAPEWDWAELTVFLRAAAVVLGPDTGVLHWADFLGTPVVMGMAHEPAYRNGPFFTRAVGRAVEVGTAPDRMTPETVATLRDAVIGLLGR